STRSLSADRLPEAAGDIVNEMVASEPVAIDEAIGQERGQHTRPVHSGFGAQRLRRRLASSLLREQAGVHEQTHGDLLEETLKQADPTKDLEAVLGDDEAKTENAATGVLAQAETRLRDATKD